MRRNAAATLILMLLCAVPNITTGQTAQYNRAELKGLADQYLKALPTHDPSGLPLAETVKYTEDTAAIPIGDGIWVGTTRVSDTFRIYAIDVPTQQVGVYTVIWEFERPGILALRLKAENGLITEIEHVLASNMSAAAMRNLETPRPALVTPVPASQRNTRAEMFMIANSYFESIELTDGDAAPYADDCIRHENGSQTTSQPAPNPADFDDTPAGRQRLGIALVDALNCEDQIESGNLSYITRIRPRRLIIIDEELGLVFGFPMFVHRGDKQTVKITGVPGVESIPKAFTAFNLMAGEIFKISGGQIHEVEANGFMLPYGASNGWDDTWNN